GGGGGVGDACRWRPRRARGAASDHEDGENQGDVAPHVGGKSSTRASVNTQRRRVGASQTSQRQRVRAPPGALSARNTQRRRVGAHQGRQRAAAPTTAPTIAP